MYDINSENIIIRFKQEYDNFVQYKVSIYNYDINKFTDILCEKIIERLCNYESNIKEIMELYINVDLSDFLNYYQIVLKFPYTHKNFYKILLKMLLINKHWISNLSNNFSKNIFEQAMLIISSIINLNNILCNVNQIDKNTDYDNILRSMIIVSRKRKYMD